MILPNGARIDTASFVLCNKDMITTSAFAAINPQATTPIKALRMLIRICMILALITLFYSPPLGEFPESWWLQVKMSISSYKR